MQDQDSPDSPDSADRADRTGAEAPERRENDGFALEPHGKRAGTATWRGLRGEMKHRRLFPIVASYAGAGWVVMEVLSALVERGTLPAVVTDLAMAWYLVGLLAATAIGWFHGERGDQQAPRAEVAFLGALLLMVLTMNGFALREDRTARLARAAAAESAFDLHRVAVLYFEDTGGGEEQYLADAVTEELIGQLARVRALDVISRNGVEPFRGGMVPPDSVARVLKAGTLVEGSIERRGEDVRVDIQLIDGASGASVQRAGFSHPAGDLQGLGAAVAEQAGRVLRAWLGEEVRLRESQRATEEMAAWSQYLRAEKLRKDGAALLAGGDTEAGLAALQEADDLASKAEALDLSWPEPGILRAQLAHMRAVQDQDAGSRWIAVALDHVERALERAPDDARALEMRGTIRWRRYYLPGGLAEEARSALFDSALADLKEAVRLDPTLASAHVTLSNLYYEVPDVSSAVLAGRTAYLEDAYLANANVVLSRLFYGSVDLQQFGEATRWCTEGGERFPGDVRFALCPIILMATPADAPEVDRAWRLVAAVDSLAIPARRDFERVRATTFTAAVLARAGLADSARAVLRRVENEIPTADPTQGLFALTAIPYILLEDQDRAIDNYKRYLLVNPQHAFKPDREIGWWWSALRDHPRFGELLAPR